MVRSRVASLCCIGILAACGGTQQPAQTADSGEAPELDQAGEEASSQEDVAAAAPGEAAESLPTTCANGDNPCTPELSFVRRLCSGSYPNVALFLFAKSSPWSRGYLTRKTKAWNASGGVSDAGYVEFDEEVIILAERRANAGGMQVSGADGGYEALRWDGSCVTLASEELTRQRPPSPKAAKVEWRYLDATFREKLREDEAVNSAYRARRAECKGVMSGTVSLKCVEADTKLSDAIIAYVRRGGEVTQPEKLP